MLSVCADCNVSAWCVCVCVWQYNITVVVSLSLAQLCSSVTPVRKYIPAVLTAECRLHRNCIFSTARIAQIFGLVLYRLSIVDEDEGAFKTLIDYLKPARQRVNIGLLQKAKPTNFVLFR